MVKKVKKIVVFALFSFFYSLFSAGSAEAGYKITLLKKDPQTGKVEGQNGQLFDKLASQVLPADVTY